MRHAALRLRRVRERGFWVFLLSEFGPQRCCLPALALDALAQGFHQIDDVGAILFFFRRLDGLAGGLALDELAQRQLILVLEFGGIEMCRPWCRECARRG